jgi:hypothetical protein
MAEAILRFGFETTGDETGNPSAACGRHWPYGDCGQNNKFPPLHLKGPECKINDCQKRASEMNPVDMRQRTFR